jgi:hypothetical protein
MEKYKIFDNGGKTIDRFTLINSDGDVFGFNEMPYYPLGFGQYCGNINEWCHRSTKGMGKRITIDELPEQAKTFVEERI